MRLKNFLLCVTSSIIFLQSINPSVEWPDPTPWPEQFHALLCMTLYSGGHQITDLWYDWPKGRNVNLQQKQLGVFMPDFLDGANYLGTEVKDGFLCNVWEKVDFIWYYEDVATKRPVRWDFYDEEREGALTLLKAASGTKDDPVVGSTRTGVTVLHPW
ncbi:hypothetical protein QQP08_027685, partial [Theobroma cacao]